MAQAGIVYHITIDLSDMDRGVYETLDLRIARHPSETTEYMLVRVLAYCLECQPGIEMTAGGVSAVDEPAVAVRDLTGRMTKWIDVGLPDADRLHRGSKKTGSVAVYTHRDVGRLMAQLDGERIHRAEDVVIRGVDPKAVGEAAALIERRSSWGLVVSGGDLHLSIGDRTVTIAMTQHSLADV